MNKFSFSISHLKGLLRRDTGGFTTLLTQPKAMKTAISSLDVKIRVALKWNLRTVCIIMQ